jgi:hypothetical protein
MVVNSAVPPYQGEKLPGDLSLVSDKKGAGAGAVIGVSGIGLGTLTILAGSIMISVCALIAFSIAINNPEVFEGFEALGEGTAETVRNCAIACGSFVIAQLLFIPVIFIARAASQAFALRQRGSHSL